MAITVSGLYVPTFLDVFDASQEPINLVGDTIKAALWTDAITPNYSTHTRYGVAPYNSDQVAGSGYTAGGEALTGKTFSETPVGTVTFNASTVTWASATFSNAHAAVIWDDTPTSPVADPLICLVNFGADFGVSSGTFSIVWATTGIYAIDITP